jgi:ribonuclease D
MISEQAEFEALLRRLDGVRELALDCEFHTEGRYHPLLCLVQVAGGGELATVDPFQVDLRPLGAPLADESVVKLFHAGENDIPLLVTATGGPVRSVFDTQIAASFVGMGAAPAYTSLVEKLVGVRLSKASRFTDWAARPLSRDQEAYALDDVRHLREVAAALRAELERRGRLAWAAMATEEMVRKARAPRDPETLYLRLGPFHGMSRRQLAILREAAAWRDRRAAEINRPLQRVAQDDALRQLALHPPRSAADIEGLRGMQGVGKGAVALYAAVKRAQELPDAELPPAMESRTRDDRVELVVQLAAAALRSRANELGIAPGLIANRDQIAQIVAWHFAGRKADPPDLLSAGGWKRAAAGDLLLDFLDGRYSLRVNPEAADGVSLVPVREGAAVE